MTKHRSLNDEKGQALTEFALVLPLLMAVLLAIVQFGIAFSHYLSLTDAVRAGARTAAVSRYESNPAAAAKDAVRAAADGLDASRLDVDVSSAWQSGSKVTVSATYPYELDIFGIVVKSGSLKSKTTERVE